MCLAIPARIVALHDGDMGTVSLGGIKVEVCLSLVEDPAVGDYVIVHTGFALNKLDTEDAELTLALLEESGALPEGAVVR
ncbi:MAG: HypC/HybG/HupF family hydrogenase formation chaperone [Azospirillum sp.]|nr:HypC/HybG/HupF family hydrogenase formation chaperone [Azospirillum sp.]